MTFGLPRATTSRAPHAPAASTSGSFEQCEALQAGSLASAEAQGPDPRSWRCPRCDGSIVRVSHWTELSEPYGTVADVGIGPAFPAARIVGALFGGWAGPQTFAGK